MPLLWSSPFFLVWLYFVAFLFHVASDTKKIDKEKKIIVKKVFIEFLHEGNVLHFEKLYSYPLILGCHSC